MLVCWGRGEGGKREAEKHHFYNSHTWTRYDILCNVSMSLLGSKGSPRVLGVSVGEFPLRLRACNEGGIIITKKERIRYKNIKKRKR